MHYHKSRWLTINTDKNEIWSSHMHNNSHMLANESLHNNIMPSHRTHQEIMIHLSMPKVASDLVSSWKR